MESKILKVFYGADNLPYKDSARAVHFPIVGNSFVGANNTTEIRFYVDRIGGTVNVSWVAISKLPNGKIGNQVLSHVGYDEELNEQYVQLDLSSYYTSVKGDVYISLNGYQGGVQVEQDPDTGIYTIVGTPIIQATGSVKLAINYAPQLPLGQHFNQNDLQQILGALSDYLQVINGIVIVSDISLADISGMAQGQILYDRASKQYYQIFGDAEKYYLPAENGRGLLGSKRALQRFKISDEDGDLFENVTFEVLGATIEDNLAVINYDGKDYLLQVNGSLPTKAIALDLNNKQLYVADINYVQPVISIFNDANIVKMVEQTSAHNILYGTNQSGEQLAIHYTPQAQVGTIVMRIGDGNILLPLTPGNNSCATSKKYVDDTVANAVATVKANAFILVDTTIYPNLNSFLASTGEEGYIYLYPINLSDLSKGYYQYIWENSSWLDIGNTTLDLSNYYTISQVDNLLNAKADKSNTYTKSETDNLLDKKVTKIANAKKVYGTDNSGNQVAFDVDYTVGADGNIVRRASSTSQIMVPLTPTANGHASSKKYVDDGLATKQNTLTFDNTPTENSSNPVTSGGVKSYVDNKVSNVYRYKGTKTVAQINALTGQVVGDVYNVSDSGTLTDGNVQVRAGDNVAWTGDEWDKLAEDINWDAYEEKFIAAGFFEVEDYDEDTGEISMVYATEIYDMNYNDNTGVLSIEAN